MRSLLLAALAALSSTVSAAPFQERAEWENSVSLVERSPAPPVQDKCGQPPAPPSNPPPTTTNQEKSFLHFEERASSSSSSCDVQKALKFMDFSAVSPALPSPAADLTLFKVVIGRGTQNYTCDLANATATPVAIGALATLYDFSCVAAERPALLNRLPRIALNQPIPTTKNTKADIVNSLEVGHHYFLNSTTPFFNLDTAAHQFGMGAMAKVNASDAPAGAPAGPHGQTGYGAVQWLFLDRMPFIEDHWQAVYRLNTAGGDPPKTCTGQPAAFEIPYAAEYWLFT